jgi:ribosomal protein L11 methyltransferase
VSFRVTVPCTRAQAEAIPDTSDLFPGTDAPPVLVADEPDPASPDEWLIHAYFDHEPTGDHIAVVASLGSGPPEIEKLGEQDWVTMSQAGLQPIRAGRFTVHTPTCPPDPDRINFEIDAGLAFGTGQHATTAGCLEALDRLESAGAQFANIADIGTGTGLLAFAAMALWPQAKCIATDIDSQAINVARENAAINGVTLGHGAGELLLVAADGMHSPMLSARAPFDLIVANILAGPLIDLAPEFAKALMAGGVVVLAGLLNSQAEAVANAYTQQSLPTLDRGFGEWPVLVCKGDA